jgi:hypothetical protein
MTRSVSTICGWRLQAMSSPSSGSEAVRIHHAFGMPQIAPTSPAQPQSDQSPSLNRQDFPRKVDRMDTIVERILPKEIIRPGVSFRDSRCIR